MFWRVDFAARGPGQALGDILARRAAPTAMAQIVARLEPDVLVMSGMDFDVQGATMNAFADLVADSGYTLLHRFAPKPNSGLQTGLDMNNDRFRQGPDDAHGYGEYAGARALAVLSQHRLDDAGVQDFTTLLWRELPGALLFSGAGPEQLAQHRLSSIAHVALPLTLPDGTILTVMVYHAGPPVFGYHPDRNLNRNHDETAFWLRLLDGDLPHAPPPPPFVLVGGSNLDPFDGDGKSAVMRDLLAHPALQDPEPASLGGAAQADPDHRGPPELDTAEWDAAQGNLRVSYILPSADIQVLGAGVLWPLPGSAIADLLSQSGTAHKPVWVDLAIN